MTEITVPTQTEPVTPTVKTVDGRQYYETIDEYGRPGQPKVKYQIELAPVNPMLLRMATTAVKLPKRPTYSITMPASGRTETHPLDELSAAEDPKDQARWEVYLEEREEAQGERTNKSMLAVFYYGAIFAPPEDGWAEDQEMLGIEVPPITRAEVRKAHFLMSMLTMQDMNGLMRAITRRMGVSEEEVAAAEESF